MKKKSPAHRINSLNDYLFLQKYYYYVLDCNLISDYQYDMAEKVLERLIKEYPEHKPKYDMTVKVDRPPAGWIEEYNMKRDEYHRKLGLTYEDFGQRVGPRIKLKGKKKK